MGRPKKAMCIDKYPHTKFFKPAGIPVNQLEHIHITPEELEALRLSNIENLNQTEIAKKMNVHQSTIQRTLLLARKKLTQAILEGKAICLKEDCDEK